MIYIYTWITIWTKGTLFTKQYKINFTKEKKDYGL